MAIEGAPRRTHIGDMERAAAHADLIRLRQQYHYEGFSGGTAANPLVERGKAAYYAGDIAGSNQVFQLGVLEAVNQVQEYASRGIDLTASSFVDSDTRAIAEQTMSLLRRSAHGLARAENRLELKDAPAGSLVIASVSGLDAVARHWPIIASGFVNAFAPPVPQFMTADGQYESLMERPGDLEIIRRQLAEQVRAGAISTVIVGEGAERALGNADVRQLFSSTFVMYDPSLTEAFAEVAALRERRANPHRMATALLLPADETQQQVMQLGDWSPETRRTVWAAASSFVRRNSLRNLVTWQVNGLGVPEAIRSLYGGSGTLKERILKALDTEEEVLILFAHGDSNELRLPDGTTFGTRDLLPIKLKSHPVVLLFSCEGALPGGQSDATASLARALKGAGAQAVWGFEQKVDARQAVALASGFVGRLEAGDTLYEAIRHLDAQRVGTPLPRVRLKISNRAPVANRAVPALKG